MRLHEITIFSLSRAMERTMRYLYRSLISKPKSLVLIFLHPNKWCNHESYFPDQKRKSIFGIFVDQVTEILRYGTPNAFYFPYGFDVKTRAQKKEYLHYSPFSRRRDYYNASSPHSTTAVLRDKLLFGMFTSYYGVDSAENLAISIDEKLFNLKIKSFQTIENFITNLDDSNSILFLKPIGGECGTGVYKMILKDNKITVNGKEIESRELREILSSSSYLIQTAITQHEKMKVIHPESVNTIRLVTIRNIESGKIEVLPSILRIGCGGSVVDNTSQGGLAVGIDLESGRLKEFGFYKPEYGTKVSVHPDSKIQFSKFVIPYFEECKKQALFLHSQLRDVHSIGWDIAVGEKGPVFVEGNDNWEINGPQICNGGMKKLFTQACGEK